MADTSDAKNLKEQYDRNGFMVIPSLLSENECDSLITEAAEICRGTRSGISGIQTISSDISDTDVLAVFIKRKE